MKFINFAVVKLAIFLVAGILASHFFPLSFLFLNILLPLFLALLVTWLIARKQLIQQVFFGIITYLCFFAIGYFSYQIRLPQFQPKHYSHITSEDTAELLQIKIIQGLKPDKFNLKYLADVQDLNGKKVSGKILFTITKDSLSETLLPDTVLLVYGSISAIPKPLNPYQFDYSKYMQSLGVYGQLRISKYRILKTLKGTATLKGKAERLRIKILKKLQQTKLKTNERAIIQALILGEKKDIDKQLYNEYAAAGAVHILAVSGLHVGILFLILSFLLKPIRRFKYGIVIHSILIVLLLWGFALISGLSPSVTRSVTMFSFFALATIFNRQSNAINTLFLSFLTLLVINPLWLFQVGFQLSYLAVFFIVWLQPLFYRIGYSKYYLVRKIWGIITVTITAQIGVLPLSLYYFHQFPGLFLLTNVVVLPFLTVLMCGGLLSVFLATLDILPDWLALFYNYLVEGLNNFIHWVATQDEFLFREIHFSALKVLGIYLLLFTIILFLKKMNYKRLVFSLMVISIFISISIFDSYQVSSNQLIVFQKSKKTILAYKTGNNLKLFTNDTVVDLKTSNPIAQYRIAMDLENYSEEKIPAIFQYNKKSILIIDSLGVYPKTENTDFIILTNSPKVNLNRLIDSIKPKQVIADGSNYYSYVKRWGKTCKTKKLSFSHTAKTGAFIIE